MNGFKISLNIIFFFGAVCFVGGSPTPQSTDPKINGDKGVENDKKVENGVPTETITTTTTTTTTTMATPKFVEPTTADPSSACGGLKGFLHLCETSSKTEDPSKNTEKRNVNESFERDESKERDESEKSKDSEEVEVKKAGDSSEEKDKETEDEDDSVISEPMYTTKRREVTSNSGFPSKESESSEEISKRNK